MAIVKLKVDCHIRLGAEANVSRIMISSWACIFTGMPGNHYPAVLALAPRSSAASRWSSNNETDSSTQPYQRCTGCVSRWPSSKAWGVRRQGYDQSCKTPKAWVSRLSKDPRITASRGPGSS